MKLLFIILLFSFKSFGQHYFVIPTMNNPEGKAKYISKKFYQLSRPDSADVTQYLFGYIKHPTKDSIAIVIDSTITLPKGAITAAHITRFLNELYSSLTTTQRNTLTNYINNNPRLRISALIINSKIKLWTRAQMDLRGWFISQTPF